MNNSFLSLETQVQKDWAELPPKCPWWSSLQELSGGLRRYKGWYFGKLKTLPPFEIKAITAAERGRKRRLLLLNSVFFVSFLRVKSSEDSLKREFGLSGNQFHLLCYFADSHFWEWSRSVLEYCFIARTLWN